MSVMFLENALCYKIYRENGFLVENAAEQYIHFKKLYTVICDSLGEFSVIDKKVFWIYNKYGIVMDTTKVRAMTQKEEASR